MYCPLGSTAINAGWFVSADAKGRIGDLLISAGGGISDLKHANAVGADGEQESALDVNRQGFVDGGKGRAGDGSERAGLVVANGDGASGREDQGLLELGGVGEALTGRKAR